VLTLLSLTSSALAETTDGPAFPCVGHWRGRGQNTGFDTSWTIDMVVTPPGADGSCGTIEYTGPVCGGRMLECRVEGGLVRVREQYTHDTTCAPAGRLEFRCQDDRMTWAWIGWERVETTLTRVGGSPTPRPAPPPPPTPAPAVPAPALDRSSPAPRTAPTDAPDERRFGCAVGHAGERRSLALALALLGLLAWRRRAHT
jgi:hypothetical protein